MTTDNRTERTAVRRPICSTCFQRPRAEGSARCEDCGPGRIMASARPAPTPMDRAAAALIGVDPEAVK